MFVASGKCQAQDKWEQHLIRLVALYGSHLKFRYLHYDVEQAGPEKKFFNDCTGAEPCTYMDCGALHFPWADTDRISIDLQEFPTNARKDVIRDYWKRWYQLPEPDRKEPRVLVEMGMAAA